MVQIFSFLLLYTKTKKPVILSGHVENQSWVNWLYQDAVSEFVVFFSKVLASKTKPGIRQQVEKEKYVAYVHATEGITGVLITDETYPYRVGFDLTRKLLSGFNKDDIKEVNKDYCVPQYNEQIKNFIKKYQNPMEADELLRVKKAVDETKLTLHQTVEKLLDRGEDLDKLVMSSGDLSDEAKKFYQMARKNKCTTCAIL